MRQCGAWPEAVRLAATGAVPLERLISRRLPASSYAEAIEIGAKLKGRRQGRHGMDGARVKTGKALIDDVDTREVPAGQCSLWWLGQHGFIAKLGRTVCYFDPYLTPDPLRRVAPLLKAEEITNASLIFGSHDHGDHIDREAWPGIAAASPRAKFIVPRLLREKIVREVGIPDDRVLGADEGIEIIECGITVTAIPAAHEFWTRIR